MPNPLIYASTTPDHSLHKGGVAVGVNSVEYNPSNGWVNGAIPTDWDYVIYKTTSGANPNIFAPANEQEFYNFVLMQGGSSSDTTSVGAALAWIATQSDLLALHSSLPNMVTDGLILALDAKQVSSYPTTGTDWYDISGADNNGEMINGLSFNSGGFFEFDGIDDKILSGGTMDAAFTTQHWTVNIQFNIDAGYSSYNAMLGNGYPFQLYVFNGKVVAYLSSTAGSSTYFLSGMTSTQTISTGKWYDLAFVRDGTNYYYYINSTLDQSATSTTATIAAANQNLQIGNLWNANYSYAWEGKIGNVKIYSESLTLSQIKQNHFQSPIVTDGLVFAADASNLVSFESGSTTTYSMTGSISGSLTNGVVFDSGNGGYWDFDGVDDYINVAYGEQILNDIGVTSGNDNDVAYSMEAWVKLDEYPAGVGNSGYSIMGHNSGDGIGLQAFGNNSSRAWFNFGYRSNNNFNSSDINLNEWYHVVGTREVGGYCRIYINGVGDNDSTNKLEVDFTTVDFGIGDSPSRIGNFNGNIAVTRIYNTALTAEEVQQNFQAQSSRFI